MHTKGPPGLYGGRTTPLADTGGTQLEEEEGEGEGEGEREEEGAQRWNEVGDRTP